MVLVPFFIKPQKERNAAIDRGYKMTSLFYARLAGLYPDLEAGWRYWFFGMYLNLVYVAYAYFVTAYVIANAIALEYMDVELIGTTLCFGSYTYVYAVITVMFLIKRTKIDRMLETAGNEVFKYQRPSTPEETAIKDAEILKGTNYGRYTYYIPSTLAVMQMAIIPAINGFKGEYSSIVNGSAPINKNTPLPVWSPVEATTGVTFFILYWVQLLPGFVEFSIVHGSCTFYIGAVCVLVSNLKLLRHSLKDISGRAMYLYRLRGGKDEENERIFQNELFQDCLTECLRENVQHHIKIIEFHHLFQDIMGYSIFCIFTGAAVAISTPPYTILKIAEMGNTEKVFSAGIVMLGHTFMSVFVLAGYCKYGQNVESESGKILDSYYCTPWYKANISYRRMLIIAMSNSQKALNIKAAVVGISASAATFMDIIKTSYSLLNFLATAR